MIDHIDPIPALIALALIVAVWLALGIRDRIRAHRLHKAATAEAVRVLFAQRVQVLNLCDRVWRGAGGEWVVCSRTHEHTGPHFNRWTGDLER